jgi:hypothetical protein
LLCDFTGIVFLSISLRSLRSLRLCGDCFYFRDSTTS